MSEERCAYSYDGQNGTFAGPCERPLAWHGPDTHAFEPPRSVAESKAEGIGADRASVPKGRPGQQVRQPGTPADNQATENPELETCHPADGEISFINLDDRCYVHERLYEECIEVKDREIARLRDELAPFRWAYEHGYIDWSHLARAKQAIEERAEARHAIGEKP